MTAVTRECLPPHRYREFDVTLGSQTYDQQATIVDSYTFHQRPQPTPANPSATGTFGTDEFIADPNDRIINDSAVLVLLGVLDATGPNND